VGAQVIDWASAGRPLAGEPESGDRCWVEEHPEGALFAVIDGLGHGTPAAEAATRAVEALKGGFGLPLSALLERCHRALRGTRGAVMSLAQVEDAAATLTWAGLGNVEGTFLSATGARDGLLTRPGIVGGEATHAPERTLKLASGDLCVLTTDGIRAGWTSSVRAAQSVKELASSILSAWARPNDDALVLAVRWLGPRP
jgi:hypothetical protein